MANPLEVWYLVQINLVKITWNFFFWLVLGSAFYIEKHDENPQRSFENLCVVTHAAYRVSWIFEMTRTSTLVEAEELCSGLILSIFYWSPLLSSSLHGQRDKLCFSQGTPYLSSHSERTLLLSFTMSDTKEASFRQPASHCIRRKHIPGPGHLASVN